MRIANIMLSQQAGGIEQAMADYCHAQHMAGHMPIAITHPGAWVNAKLKQQGTPVEHLRNFGQWDIWAARRLRSKLHRINPDLVIAHANRAISLSYRAIKDIYPLAGVANNYQTRRFSYVDMAFAPTRDLIEKVIEKGVPRNKAFYIPNMIECAELPSHKKRGHPVVIGTMGRFVNKKGFHIYLQALAKLKERGFSFRAVLGGSGEDESKLKKLAQQLGLEETVEFIGWVEDRKHFYDSIDIFVLPSLHEPFGIVLLEAFVAGVPVVSTDTEGPRDIITAGEDALIVPKNNADALAEGIATLLIDENRANKCALSAFTKTQAQFSFDAVSRKMHSALHQIHAKAA